MRDFDDRAFRDALGHFTTGVTVVTTMTEDGPLGMTVNSFASVSLDPPLVLWSPARHSDRFPAFEAASHFAIHVLNEDQADLSMRFATTGTNFDGLDYLKGAGDAPLFEDCAARFECRHAAGYDGGDHLIVVGEVLRFDVPGGLPLLYHRGSYARLSRD